LKKAYLTIDDAPSRDFMAKMEFLYQHGVPALFFCEGRFIPQHETALCAAIERGFLLGNHAFSHPHFSDISVEECRQEIQRTDDLLEAIYHRAGIERPARYFRFPYFDTGGDESGTAYEAKWSRPASEWFQFACDEKRKELQQYLRELGYCQPQFEGVDLKYFHDPYLLSEADIRCTYDQAEYWLHNADAPWELSEEAAILARIEENFPYEGRSLNCEETVDIILVHDHEYTTALFYRIVERYIEKGIQFLRIPDPVE
jgi:peptidoglycan-N-acetylglucosamine deacetylase